MELLSKHLLQWKSALYFNLFEIPLHSLWTHQDTTYVICIWLNCDQLNFYPANGLKIIELWSNANDKVIQTKTHHFSYKLLLMKSNRGYDLKTQNYTSFLPPLLWTIKTISIVYCKRIFNFLICFVIFFVSYFVFASVVCLSFFYVGNKEIWYILYI